MIVDLDNMHSVENCTFFKGIFLELMLSFLVEFFMIISLYFSLVNVEQEL